MRKLALCFLIALLIGSLTASALNSLRSPQANLHRTPASQDCVRVFSASPSPPHYHLQPPPRSQNSLPLPQPLPPPRIESLSSLPAEPPARPLHSTLDQGSDNCEGVRTIPDVPYTDTGTTAGRINDWNTVASCAGGSGGSNAPDVIYEYVPDYGGTDVIISTCGSAFNTLLEVRAGGDCPGSVQLYCADAGCGGDAELHASLMVDQIYYIIVDGYGTQSGNYTLSVRPVCNIAAHPGDLTECAETADTSHARLDCNGGPCNTLFGGTPSYTNILCGQSCFSRAFTYSRAGASYYDTDWYRFSLAEACTVRISVDAEFPSMISAGLRLLSCADHAYTAYGNSCTPYALTIPNVSPGDYEFTVRPWDAAGISTPLDYRVTLDCLPMSGCKVDMTLTAPGTVTGSTTGAGNDCAFWWTADRTVRVHIPYAGLWTFSLCETPYTWGPWLYLSASCCDISAPIGTCHTCPVLWMPEISDQYLEAGTYYLTIEGVGPDIDEGPFILTVDEGCRVDHTITAPGVVSGNTCGAGDDCNMHWGTGEDEMTSIVIPTDDDWTFEITTPEWWPHAQNLMRYCCSENIWGTSYSANIRCQHLTPGTYFFIVEGVDTLDCGEYTLTITRCRNHCCYSEPDYLNCVDTSRTACDVLSGIFDEYRVCADTGCSYIPPCTDHAIYSQRPYGVTHTMADAYLSDLNHPDQDCYDYLDDLPAPFSAVRFWGMTLTYPGYMPCSENPLPVTVSFYADSDHYPGAVLYSRSDTLFGIPEAVYFGRDTLYQYNTLLPVLFDASHTYIRIAGSGNPDCDFFWMTSPLGDGWIMLPIDSHLVRLYDVDFAFCLGGCTSPDSLVLQAQGDNLFTISFYAPVDATYRFYMCTSMSGVWPGDYSEFYSHAFTRGRHNLGLSAPPLYCRYAVTTDCGGSRSPAASSSLSTVVRIQ